MQRNAPYASSVIRISLRSSVGLRYRTLNCMECGQPFIDRNANEMFRLDIGNHAEEVHLNAGGQVEATCPRCTQQYALMLSMDIDSPQAGIPLFMQPQSFYISNEPVKHLRDTFCLECGKAFYSISDRIEQVIDNIVPADMLDVTRLGPMEARCRFQHCKQKWYVRV